MDNNKSLIGRIRDYMAHRREKQRTRMLAWIERHYEKTTLPAGTPLRRRELMDSALPLFWLLLTPCFLMCLFLARIIFMCFYHSEAEADVDQFFRWQFPMVMIAMAVTWAVYLMLISGGIVKAYVKDFVGDYKGSSSLGRLVAVAVMALLCSTSFLFMLLVNLHPTLSLIERGSLILFASVIWDGCSSIGETFSFPRRLGRDEVVWVSRSDERTLRRVRLVCHGLLGLALCCLLSALLFFVPHNEALLLAGIWLFLTWLVTFVLIRKHDRDLRRQSIRS